MDTPPPRDEPSPYTGETRGDLLRLDRRVVAAQACRVLSGFPDVAGAYLFGSALDFVGRGSDVDLGLVMREPLAAEREFEVCGSLEERLGSLGRHRFHVTVVRPEEIAFAFSVLRDGALLYVADAKRVTDVIERVGREHDDLEPFRKTFYAALGMRM